MSLSTHIVGYRPADDRWRQMVAAWSACRAAGIPPPKAVVSFFDDQDPTGQIGQEVTLGAAVRPWRDDHGREGYDVDLTTLPPEVRVLRFYHSW